MPAPLNRHKEIFLHALDLPPAGRPDYLAQACGDDGELRRRVEAMLSAHAAGGSFLEKPAVALAATVDVPGAVPAGAEPAAEGPGARIGPYKLLEQIGEGGMGVVYMAEQTEPVRRLVALKLIRPGLAGGQFLARFEAERQALALMDHPNIAKVLDAGATPDSRPYFVMELVRGTPITKFCAERGVPLRERLSLFVAVCQAVQHAHTKGVIHRDIKPSNVLVALYDDCPVVKVIDFGVAKAAGGLLTERTLHTGFGAIVGTPEYMSPEQATFNQLDIDTRSDVYSLGVLLYELLTGTTPVDRARLKEAALLEVLRVVREEDPPPPSLRLSTATARAGVAAAEKAAAEKAAAEKAEAVRLSRLLRGELDWVVMKALEKDRGRRYETAAGLGRDVERYLRDELVEARPPGPAYRLVKFVRRHRAAVLSASAVLLVLLASVAALTKVLWQRNQAIENTERALAIAREFAAEAFEREAEAEENARQARRAADEARAVLSFLQDKVLAAGRPRDVEGGLGEGVTLAAAIRAAEPELAARFQGQPLAEASIRHALGLTYSLVREAGDDELARAAVRQLERSWELRKQHMGEDHPETVRVLEDLAWEAFDNDPGRGAAPFGELARLRRGKLSRDNWEEFAQGLLFQGHAHRMNGEPAKAIPLYEEVVGLPAALGVAENELMIAGALGHLGEAYAEAGRRADAVRVLREYVGRSRSKPEPVLMNALQTHGVRLTELGYPAEAEAVLREALTLREKLDPRSWTRFNTVSCLGAALAAQGKAAEAGPLLKEAYEGLAQAARGGEPWVQATAAEAGARLAAHYEASGRPAEAARVREEVKQFE